LTAFVDPVEMDEDLAGFLIQAKEDTTAAADEMSAKVGSAANSMHGYLVGYARDQVGGALLVGVDRPQAMRPSIQRGSRSLRSR
jgi:hypothetical protein